MQPATDNLSRNAAYAGGGSVGILILEVSALIFGISDGSLAFVIPFFLSPILGIAGIVLGIKALRRKSQPRALAILGLLLGGFSVLLFIGFIIFIVMLASALSGL
jgi:hypothetical protein